MASVTTRLCAKRSQRRSGTMPQRARRTRRIARHCAPTQAAAGLDAAPEARSPAPPAAPASAPPGSTGFATSAASAPTSRPTSSKRARTIAGGRRPCRRRCCRAEPARARLVAGSDTTGAALSEPRSVPPAWRRRRGALRRTERSSRRACQPATPRHGTGCRRGRPVRNRPVGGSMRPHGTHLEIDHVQNARPGARDPAAGRHHGLLRPRQHLRPAHV